MRWARRNWLFLLCGATAAGLWAIPLARGFAFLHRVALIFQDDGSSDSYEDCVYARQLLIFYFSGAISTELILWMLIHFRNPALLPHIIIAMTGMSLIIADRPESVIVFLPPLLISPFVLAGCYLFLLLGAVAIVLGAKLFEHIDRKYPVIGLDQ